MKYIISFILSVSACLLALWIFSCINDREDEEDHYIGAYPENGTFTEDELRESYTIFHEKKY